MDKIMISFFFVKKMIEENKIFENVIDLPLLFKYLCPCGTMVEHSTHNLKIMGSDSATGNEVSKIVKK